MKLLRALSAVLALILMVSIVTFMGNGDPLAMVGVKASSLILAVLIALGYFKSKSVESELQHRLQMLSVNQQMISHLNELSTNLLQQAQAQKSEQAEVQEVFEDPSPVPTRFERILNGSDL